MKCDLSYRNDNAYAPAEIQMVIKRVIYPRDTKIEPSMKGTLGVERGMPIALVSPCGIGSAPE